MVDNRLKRMIVTGASGIVGRNFLEAAREDYFIYAIARRSQREAGVDEHPNIKWIQVDIGNWLSLRWVMHNIKRMGGADYLLHLASYYDFDYGDHPEFERTNIKGTRYILEQAKILRIKRFIFASSTAACDFPPRGGVVDEKSAVDADYAYARAKRIGEQMVADFSQWFPCSIVRFAAVFTDWCEYAPLYVFLQTWLSKSWNARILGGKGESAVTYIHSHDLNKLLLAIFHKSGQLPDLDTYVASPDGCTTHLDLFRIATRFFFGRRLRPIFMPKVLAWPGVVVRHAVGKWFGNPPFERPWMIRYLDKQLAVDASYTRKALGWRPTPRYHVTRRLLFLIEKKKSDPHEWVRMNEAAMERVPRRPNLQIYEELVQRKEDMVRDIRNTLSGADRRREFSRYQEGSPDILEWDIAVIYQLLSSTIRNNDRMLLLEYVRDLALMRRREGFSANELCIFLLETGKIISARLLAGNGLKTMRQPVYDYIALTLQLAVDEVEDVYEKAASQMSESDIPDRSDIEAKIREMDDFYQIPDDDILK